MKHLQHKIIEKAWNVRHISFNWYQTELVYAVNANQAKSKLEKLNDEYKYKENTACRNPENDIIELNGIKGTQSNVQHKIKQINRIQKIKDLPDDDTLYVIRNGYVGNVLICWGHNGAGYATLWENIGQYTKTDLVKLFNNDIRDQDVIYPVVDILPGLKTMVESQYISHKNKI
jgi:hypothetical protein